MLSLDQVVDDFAEAFKAVDATRPQGASRARVYRPGIGPLTEADAVNRVLRYLQEALQHSIYQDASPKQYPNSRQQCDLVIPGEWAIEFKLLRPFGDNGNVAEHWSENVLHPYPGNVSSIGDCIKLMESGFSERKGIIVFGYEHSPPQIDRCHPEGLGALTGSLFTEVPRRGVLGSSAVLVTLSTMGARRSAEERVAKGAKKACDE